jgi:hypothetical protein
LRAEGFSPLVAWASSAILDKKNIHQKFPAVNFFQFMVIITLGRELDPDPQLEKMLDPDPH